MVTQRISSQGDFLSAKEHRPDEVRRKQKIYKISLKGDHPINYISRLESRFGLPLEPLISPQEVKDSPDKCNIP